jgi:hypothetical protein
MLVVALSALGPRRSLSFRGAPELLIPRHDDCLVPSASALARWTAS